MSDTLLIIFTVLSGFLVLYHHLGYPLIMRAIQRKKTTQDAQAEPEETPRGRPLPSIGIVIPAYNEQRWIAEKIRNLAMLDYPPELLKVVIACDGCSDDTADIAHRTANEHECRHLPIEIRRFATNRGKVAVINEVIQELDTELIALSDVSALVSMDALLIAADQFQNPEVGVLNSHYQLLTPGSEGEAAYWQYQSRLKASEAALGSTLGAHGAFYLFRRTLFKRLAPDTINDDFILPMQIVAEGYRAEHENRITALELEGADNHMEQQRRRRIAAGNLQQLLRLKRLLLPRYGYVAFTFASGKGLRVLMPFLMLGALLGSLLLAHTHAVFAVAAFIQTAAYGLAAWQLILAPKSSHRHIKTLAYLVSGHLAGLIGSLRYLFGLEKGRWKRIKPGTSHSATRRNMNTYDTINPLTGRIKRMSDLVLAGMGLLITLPLFPLIATAIKLDSPGPVLFRQLRIGKATPSYVSLFEMIKFRTMRNDAESKTGAVWAKKRDPRITRVGRFLRKTRLDELPQLFNVLAGDMSMIGPRPERPGFYQDLEKAIPFFAERTYGVAPGITGLAQVNQGYDTCIEDVRSKVGFDHRYALALDNPVSWLKMDLGILFRTVMVMATGRGQ